MMIKCQNCGFENQMGSIFCRECGGKLDMDAIDPNKLQKDVNKEKNIKLAKKRVKSAISAACSILIIGGFIFAIIYRGWEDNKDYSVVEETQSEAAAAAQKKFDAVMRGTTVGKVKYTYPELNYMFRDQVVKQLYELDSFAKIVSFELGFNEEKGQPMANIWIKIKDKVPVRYVVYGDFFLNVPEPDSKEDILPIGVDVRRLDIGLIPLYFSTHTFLNGFTPLIDNESMRNFFRNAKTVEFTSDGLEVEFGKGTPAQTSSLAPSSSGKPSAAAGVAALKGGSAAVSEKDEAAREAARQKAEEEKEKKRQAAEERKRKQEEEAERKRQKEEERKQKIEEEKERKRQAEEERKRKQEEEAQRRREEADRRREEAEQRRRDRENDRYNNRNNRNSRNNRW